MDFFCKINLKLLWNYEWIDISNEEKQNLLRDRELLQKQLKVLKLQKRIHDKLSLSLSFI